MVVCNNGSAMMFESYGHLVGHRFPGARVALAKHEAWLWADAVGSSPDDRRAHPSVAYLIGLRGTGMQVKDVFELLGARADDGVLLGET